MIKQKTILAFVLFTCIAISQTNISEEIKFYQKDLPFKMREIQPPVFPDAQFNVTDFGAKGDGQLLNTEYINKAIAECSSKGGGKVIIPAGLWKTGSIELKSNVNLHLEKGAVVFFSEDHKDFPLITTNNKTYFVQNPIYGYELTNVAVTGEGLFTGNGQSWRPVKKNKLNASEWKELVKSGGALNEAGDMWYPNENARDAEVYLKQIPKADFKKEDFEKVKDFLRPNMLELVKCTNVYIDGITLQNSPKFSLYLRSCENILIREVKVVNEWWTQNSDGIDLSACKNAMIIKCTVNTGDDGICMKSSGKPESAPALENIVIADCIVYRGHGGFVIGSNTDGGMKNISVKNCNFIGTDAGLRFKSGIGNGGLVEGVFIENIFMKDIVNEAIIFDLTYEDGGAVKSKFNTNNEQKYPLFKNIEMKNVFCDGTDYALKINRIDSSIENISLDNVYIKGKQSFNEKDAEGFSFNNVKFTTGSGFSFSK